MINVVIIEDNKYLREGWKTFIDFDPDTVVENVFGSCEEAFNSDSLLKCDVALMDIGLPGMSGIDGIKIIKKKYPNIEVIVASVFDDDDNIFKAVKAGAVGYLMKKVTPDELVAAIKEAHTGGSPLTPSIARRIIDSLQPKKLAGGAIELNERELEILNALARGKSYQEIGKEIYLSVDGVRHHIRNIYQKLEVNSRSEAVSVGITNNIINP